MKLSDQIRKKIKGVKEASPFNSLAKEIAQIVVTSIQGNARLGKAPDKSQLAELADEGKHHKWLKKYGNAGQFFGNGERPYNISGQFLDSIKGIVKGDSIEIAPDGSRQPYKGPNGPLKGIDDNFELGLLLNARRRIFYISEPIKKRIVNLVKGYFRRYLSK